MKFVPCDKTAKVLPPCEQAPDFPSAAIAPQGTPVLRFCSFPSVWGDHFNIPIFFQLDMDASYD
jgi:hypothetical protein